VVPYAVPIYYGGGYGMDYYGAPQQQPQNITVVVPQQPTPPVIINQTFAGGEAGRTSTTDLSSLEPQETGGLHVWEPNRSTHSAPSAASSADSRSFARDSKPTIYLIAMKDSSVRQAIGFWTEGGTTLAYVTPDAVISRVGLDAVDREMSVQLNAERNLDFDLRAR